MPLQPLVLRAWLGNFANQPITHYTRNHDFSVFLNGCTDLTNAISNNAQSHIRSCGYIINFPCGRCTSNKAQQSAGHRVALMSFIAHWSLILERSGQIWQLDLPKPSTDKSCLSRCSDEESVGFFIIKTGSIRIVHHGCIFNLKRKEVFFPYDSERTLRFPHIRPEQSVRKWYGRR